jgi:hypothetical protein
MSFSEALGGQGRGAKPRKPLQMTPLVQLSVSEALVGALVPRSALVGAWGDLLKGRLAGFYWPAALSTPPIEGLGPPIALATGSCDVDKRYRIYGID